MGTGDWNSVLKIMITRSRLGHRGLNASLNIIDKHPEGKCNKCNEHETAKHTLINTG